MRLLPLANVIVQIYARIISWVLLLGENYSCHFWLPIIFHFTFLFLFLYSVLKVRVAYRLYQLTPRLPNSPFDESEPRCGTGGSPVVGSNGLEPSTSRLSGVRSNHLSYEPISVAGSFPIGQTCWWRRTESNCRPPACKAGALPAELRPRIRFVPG